MASLKVQVSTWDKLNYELYDAEAEQYKKAEFLIDGGGLIYRDNQENESHFSQEELKDDIYKNGIVIRQLDQFVLSNKPDIWIQLQGKSGLPDLYEFVQIRQGDILKLGKKVFKILSIISGQQQSLQFEKNHYENFDSMLSNYDSITEVQTGEIKNQCRVCLRSSYDKQNPLLSVCKCSGSTKFIHYQCLRTWLDTKVLIKHSPPYLIEINSKSVKCEICLAFYPHKIEHKGEEFILYNLGDLKLGNHVIMEDIEGEVLVLNFQGTQYLTLGRGHESNIKISEITISRTHVKFFLNDHKLYIQDQQSKFGTLLKVQQPIRVEEKDSLFLQSGRSRINVTHSPKERKFCNLFCQYGD